VNFDQIETFLTLVKCKNYSRAAEELNITQPAVTARINNLEEELSCLLFVNKGRLLSLTKEGEQFFSFASKTHTYYNDMKYAISQRKNGFLYVGLPPNFPSSITSKILKVGDQHSISMAIRKGFDSSELIQLVLKDELSFALVHGCDFREDLVFEKVTSVSLQFIISPSHPLAHHVKIEKKMLHGETFICYAKHTQHTKMWSSMEEKLDGISLRRIEVSDSEMIKHLVRYRSGFTILPELTISDDEQELFCTRPFSPLNESFHELHVVYKTGSESAVYYQPFIRSLIKEIQSYQTNQSYQTK
jgi:DNA-binding transcriptional LysR family regulator